MLKRQNMSEVHIKNKSCFQKWDILNKNPVFLAHHFQSRIVVFFTEILIGSDLLGEIKYYAIIFEF